MPKFHTALRTLATAGLCLAASLPAFAGPEILRVELSRELDLFFALWQRLLRYIAPLAIAVILIAALLGLAA